MSLANMIMQRDGFRKQSNRTWEGPCPRCGDDKRLIVWIHNDIFKCQVCEFKGDAVTFLREISGIGCGEAHLELGKECISPDCAGYGKCAATRSGASRMVRSDKQRKLETPQEKKPTTGAFQPTGAVNPKEIWQERAQKLVDTAHETLLNTPEQLDFLAARGIPLGAVDKNRLGWLPADYYRAREVWGLEPECFENGKKKQFWLPPGIIIPFFQGETIHRIRIRVPDWKLEEIRQSYAKQGLDKKAPRYYWVLGSGDDTWVINPGARAFVVVESDLDGLLVDWHAGDLVGTIPLGTCSARPKEAAAKLLSSSVCILNALDFEPRLNKTTGRNENPGGENWLRWWKPQYSQARRHPVPEGKDPGEAFKAGVDIRSWIISGLPAGLKPATTPEPVPVVVPVPVTVAVVAPVPATIPEQKRVELSADEILKGKTDNGKKYIIVPDVPTRNRLALEHPGMAIFTRAETLKLKGLPKEAAEYFIIVKETFGVDAEIEVINWEKEQTA